MKAVIPAAGLGTRFLPATKAQPKEMLPVVDRPTIQYAVEEAANSGISDILIITGKDKRAIVDHFDKSPNLESVLMSRGDNEMLKRVREIEELASIFYVHQKEQRGLGDAVLCAKPHIQGEAFAVLLGDDIIASETPCTKLLMDVHKERGCPVLAIERVPLEKTSQYGVIAGTEVSPGLYKVEDIVEKPGPESAPSDLAVIGRYLLTPDIFGKIEETMPGVGGEIQLTDAIRALLAEREIYAIEVPGTRYDIGKPADWIRANIELGMKDENIGPALRKYIDQICQRLD